MPGENSADDPPRGLRRALLRFPILLYRLRLGFLLGHRFLLLTHMGRKSGRPRQVVLEVVRYDESTGTCIVASGRGERSHWFRNIQKTPRVTVTLGRQRLPAEAIRLTWQEAEQEFLEYARRRPLAFRILSDKMTAQPSEDMAERCRFLSQSIPVVAFRPLRKSSGSVA